MRASNWRIRSHPKIPRSRLQALCDWSKEKQNKKPLLHHCCTYAVLLMNVLPNAMWMYVKLCGCRNASDLNECLKCQFAWNLWILTFDFQIGNLQNVEQHRSSFSFTLCWFTPLCLLYCQSTFSSNRAVLAIEPGMCAPIG